MYLRFRAKYYNEKKDRIEFGVFSAAEYLKKHGTLEKEDRNALEAFIHYFDHELPIPDYYQDEKNRQAAKSATSWFKNSAEDFIGAMNKMALILQSYQVEVERIHSKRPLGKLIYEDDFQVTILPYRDVKKKVQ